jgi:hypothetical protein
MLFIMRIGDTESFIEFKLIEVQPENPSGSEAVSCSVEASCEGFNGKVEGVWFSSDEIDSFLSELQRLEEKRKGSVSLTNMSSLSEYSPLYFEIFSIDEIGHFAVKADLQRVYYDEAADLRSIKLSVGFLIDPGNLSAMLIEFHKLFDYRRGRI